ncbi:MAG: GNAT family N-acetyltransferase [Lachnospiraceae bacterium]|nr:GNAT family N-acetyltransferase [Lachnospiraceae bacterium]
MNNYKLIKNYRENDELRLSLNGLAKKTFGLDFEGWYRNGYWKDNYNPYSIVVDGRVVSNVSVNTIDIVWDGEVKHFIQLGTVMTDEAYRNKGLMKIIMKEIENDYKGVDGMYLYANDSVLNFYPKFGFKQSSEYKYSKSVEITKQRSMKQVPMADRQAWDKLVKIINKSVPCGRFEMTGNSGLIMFYITNFMQECVFYDKALDVYVIAEPEDENLLIHNVFSEKPVKLDKVIEAFGSEIKHVELGFTPYDCEDYDCELINEEDTTFFVKGKLLEGFENAKLMFPTLSHA